MASSSKLKSGAFISCTLGILASFLMQPAVPPASAADTSTAGAGNVASAEAAAPPDTAALLALTEAYRSGFFELAWLSCYQVYDSLIAEAAAFSAGGASPEAAQDSLTTPGLLLSSVYGSLAEIAALTPQADAQSADELTRLGSVIQAEDAFLQSLLDWFSQPGKPELETAAMQAKEQLEAVLEKAAPHPEPAAAAPGGAGA